MIAAVVRGRLPAQRLHRSARERDVRDGRDAVRRLLDRHPARARAVASAAPARRDDHHRRPAGNVHRRHLRRCSAASSSVAQDGAERSRRTRRWRALRSAWSARPRRSGSPGSTRTGSPGQNALLLGLAVAVTAPLGDLFESYIKRDFGVKDSGKAFGAHGGAMDRADAALFMIVVGLLRVVRDGAALDLAFTLMRRVLILGSTGSIGTQALDVIERNNDLIVVGLSAGTRPRGADRAGAASPRRDDRARRAQTPPRSPASSGTRARSSPGIDGIIRLIIETECDIVLNAIVGSAGLAPTIADARRGDRPRARQQGVAGRRRRARHAARRRHRRGADPGRLRAFGALSAGPRRAAGHGRPSGADGLRRPVPRSHARRARERQRSRTHSRIRPGTWAARSRSTRRR